jgi:excisionase family DNA binding protein
MINRRPIVANDANGKAAGEDDLTRLVRVIAREAAREAFKAFAEALNGPVDPSGPLMDPSIPRRSPAEGTTSDASQTNGSNERFLSVAQVADRLGLSEKSVRRKIARGELDAHRVGKLLRVRERGLDAYLARARLGKHARM